MSQLDGQTVVVIGGSAGMGLETARLARAAGAEVVITGRDPGRLERAAADVGARSSAAFDAGDPTAMARFFEALPGAIDHVMLTAGRPTYSRLLDLDAEGAREALSERIVPALEVARGAAPKMGAGGSLVLIGGTGARKISREIGIGSAAVAAMAAFAATLALELAPIRVNLINPGFVDTGLSARVLGDGLEARRQELRRTLPIGRVIEPTDVAALAVQLMTNTAITGAGFDIDGARGNYCPKEHQQHLDLAANYPKIAVAYTKVATISTDTHHSSQEFRASTGAQWPFLSDPERTVQKDLDIQEYTDPEHDPMVPHTFVLAPGLVIHTIYNGYWFWGRPTFADLSRDLMAVTRQIRPDWDLGKPGLREAWDAGDYSSFHGWDKRAPGSTPTSYTS